MAKAVKKNQETTTEAKDVNQLEIVAEVVETNEIVEVSPVKSAIIQLSQEGAVDLIVSEYKGSLPATPEFLKLQEDKICKVVITSLDQIEDIEFLTNAGKELRKFDKDVKEQRKDIDKPFKAVTDATIEVEKEFLSLTKKSLDHIKLQDQSIRQLKEEQVQIEEEKLRLKTKERVEQLKAIGLETTVLGWSIEFNGEKFEMDLPTLQQMEDSTFLLQLESAKAIVEKYNKDQEEKAEQARIAEEEKQKLIDAKEEADKKAKEAEDRIKELEAEKKRMEEEQDERERKAKADADAEREKFIVEKRIFEFEKLGFNFNENIAFYDNREFFRVIGFSKLCEADFGHFYISQKEKLGNYKYFVHKCNILDNLLGGTGIKLSKERFEEIAYSTDESDLKNKVDELVESNNKFIANQRKQLIDSRCREVELLGFVYNESTKSYIYTASHNDWCKSISIVVSHTDDYITDSENAINAIKLIEAEKAEEIRKSLLPSAKDAQMIEEYFDQLITLHYPDVDHLKNFGSDLLNLIDKYRKTMY